MTPVASVASGPPKYWLPSGSVFSFPQTPVSIPARSGKGTGTMDPKNIAFAEAARSGKPAVKTVTVKPPTKAPKQTKEEALAIAAGRPPCLCGCGGYPKGKNARYVPGHDARHHAALKRAEAEVAAARTPAPVNTQERPPAPSRRRKAKEDTSRAAGNDPEGAR